MAQAFVPALPLALVMLLAVLTGSLERICLAGCLGWVAAVAALRLSTHRQTSGYAGSREAG